MTQSIFIPLTSARPIDGSFAAVPRIALIAGTLLLNAALVATVVITALWDGFQPDLYFAEGSVVTVWSSLQIIAVCGMCLWLFQLRRESNRASGRRAHVLWLLAAIGAAALSIDEAASIHESIDQKIHAMFAIRENPWTDRIDDLIVLGYGLIAMTVTYICRAELKLLRSAADILIAAFALFAVMVVIDLLTNSYSISPGDGALLARLSSLRGWGVVVEDSFKVISEGIFVAGLVTAALSIKRGKGSLTEFSRGRSHSQ